MEVKLEMFSSRFPERCEVSLESFAEKYMQGFYSQIGNKLAILSKFPIFNGAEKFKV